MFREMQCQFWKSTTQFLLVNNSCLWSLLESSGGRNLGHCCLFGFKFMLLIGGCVVVLQYDLIIELGDYFRHIFWNSIRWLGQQSGFRNTQLLQNYPLFAGEPKNYGNSFSQKPQKPRNWNSLTFATKCGAPFPVMEPWHGILTREVSVRWGLAVTEQKIWVKVGNWYSK